jgi:hypothetical protein
MSEAFARYQLLERIAIGGTAEVFRALFLAGDGSKRKVVIKRVLPQFARDERFRRLFHEEACVAVTMSHPSIVRVLDHGDIGQTCYIALELVEGKDLGTLLEMAATARPSPLLASYLTAQVSRALQFIHDQTSSEGTPLRIIHRDVSPQNILVSYDGDVKLTDFGIAKSAIRQERTVDGVLRGKLEFMAPEQATLSEVDHRADIFALGCVFYTMLHGTPPFRGESELQTLARVQQGRMACPPEALPVPEQLQRIVARALQPDKALRYQRASEMAADLQAFLDGAPETITPAVLGQWVTRVVHGPEQVNAGTVDEAVRRLLGQEEDQEFLGRPRASSTTVFATTAEVSTEQAAPARPRPLERRLSWALGAVALLGVVGWLLWAFNVFQSRAVDPPSPDGALSTLSPTARHDARGSSSYLPGDQRVRAPATRLTILSEPDGVQVWREGQVIGRTPLVLDPPLTSLTLELRHEGYHPWRRHFTRTQAGREIRAQLVPLASSAMPPVAAGFGYLTINSWPWSKVRLDGRVIGNTPQVKIPVRPGRHVVDLLSDQGQLRKSYPVIITKGAHRSIAYDQTQRGP